MGSSLKKVSIRCRDGLTASGARERVRPPLAVPVPTGDRHFDPPRREARRANVRIPRSTLLRESDARRDAQAGVPSAGWPRAQLAFKNSMVRWILQFTPSIAFCCVLHRCESRDIRCRESYISCSVRLRRARRLINEDGRRLPPADVFLGARRAGGSRFAGRPGVLSVRTARRGGTAVALRLVSSPKREREREALS